MLLYRNYKGPLGSEDRAAIGVERSGLNNADLQAITNMDLLGANKDSVRASRCRRGRGHVAVAAELTERGRACAGPGNAFKKLLDSHVALNRRKKKGAVVEEVPYATSRYQPLLAKILEVRPITNKAKKTRPKRRLARA